MISDGLAEILVLSDFFSSGKTPHCCSRSSKLNGPPRDFENMHFQEICWKQKFWSFVRDIRWCTWCCLDRPASPWILPWTVRPLWNILSSSWPLEYVFIHREDTHLIVEFCAFSHFGAKNRDFYLKIQTWRNDGSKVKVTN